MNLSGARRPPEAVLAAASNRDERCEAQFYVGEWYLLRDARIEAQTALRVATDICRKDFSEYAGAVSELKRLGQLQ